MLFSSKVIREKLDLSIGEWEYRRLWGSIII